MDSTIEEWEESELEDLLRRARHGSREALEELLERTEGIVRNVAKRDLFYGTWGPEQSYENARAGLLHFACHQQDPVAADKSGGLVKTCVSRYLLSLLRQEIRRRPANGPRISPTGGYRPVWKAGTTAAAKAPRRPACGKRRTA